MEDWGNSTASCVLSVSHLFCCIWILWHICICICGQERHSYKPFLLGDSSISLKVWKELCVLQTLSAQLPSPFEVWLKPLFISLFSKWNCSHCFLFRFFLHHLGKSWNLVREVHGGEQVLISGRRDVLKHNFPPPSIFCCRAVILMLLIACWIV